MDVKTAVIDNLDPRPIKKATIYALGTALEGIAFGIFLSVVLPDISSGIRLGAAALCFVVGAVLAVSAYSSLKRKYMIVERNAEQSSAGNADKPRA
jgi:hypothetical protein